MKLNAYYFNNAEYEDVYLCDEHDSPPCYGMWVKATEKVEENPDEDIVCQECGDK